MSYTADKNRYNKMTYRRSGKSGIKLPIISLGLWHNFGDVDNFENSKKMIFKAFDSGITHFDLANNYGPPPGSAEINFGKIINNELKSYRDELIISSKAGYTMWDGPYGDWGSRKYLIASCEQSLKRMGLDYVDIFYHHRPDYETPLEETMMALDQIVKSGKALYAGISRYDSERTQKAVKILRELRTPFLIHQPRYNMFDRSIEKDLLKTLETEGIGCIVFSPLSQGLLTNKYLNGIPKDSRAGRENTPLNKESITDDKLDKIRALNELAQKRNQSLAQMSICWVLRNKTVTSALIGASKVEQIEEIIKINDNLKMYDAELDEIESILSS